MKVADQIWNIELSKIHSDAEFNCRGNISAISILPLARDIEKRGLQMPIIIQKISGDYTYKIISGHRRYKAHQHLNKKYIKCIVSETLDGPTARILNLSENLNRKDLNILQEALALEKFDQYGWSQTKLASEIGQSRGWVQARLNLLNLPYEIQQEAAAGYLTTDHIKSMQSLNKDEQIAFCKKVKERKLKGLKGSIKVNKIITNHKTKRARKKKEIFDKINEILNILGGNLATKALAWTTGELTDGEFYKAIKEEAEVLGINYIIPETMEMDS